MPAFMAGFSPEGKNPAIGQFSTLMTGTGAKLWTGTQLQFASGMGTGCPEHCRPGASPLSKKNQADPSSLKKGGSPPLIKLAETVPAQEVPQDEDQKKSVRFHGTP
jgi:hypothetical protein